MDYRKENYCFDKRKYSNDKGFHPQNTFTNLRYHQNEIKNPRDYQNVNTPTDYQNVTPRDYQNVRMSRYHKNDKDFRPKTCKDFRSKPYKDFRPEPYKNFRPEPYKRDFHFKDRDDRPLLSEIHNKLTTMIKIEPGLNYVRNVRNWESGNNERRLLIDDEDFKNWNIGVEFNVTSDRHKKLHWQTKEQMDSYGMVGGHFYKEDRHTGEIFKGSLYGQCGLPQHESTGRSRSMSKPREPRTNSRPKPVKPRSRSVCFSEEITQFEYEKEDESDMNDFSQDNMEIDDDDRSRSDVLESENIDEQGSERKKIPENSKSGIASVQRSSSKNSDNRIKKKLVKDSVQDLRSNKDSEKLVKDSEQGLRSHKDSEKLVKDSEQDLRSNEYGEKLVKDSEQDLISNEGGEKLVKDSEQDVRNNEGGNNPDKDLVQDVRINEGVDKPGKLLVQDLRLSEFVCLFVNKPFKDSVQDMESNDCINNSPYNLGANICSRSADNQPLSKLPLKDIMSSVKSQKKFHGFSIDFSTDLRQLELRTSIIKMQNQYEEDCQEFAQNSYDVIMESTLADINQTCHDYSQVDVHKAETIFDVKLSDSFQDYLIPIEDIFEDVAVHMVNTDEPLLMSQEEEFDAETSVALSTVLRSPEMSTPVDNDLLSLRQESSLRRYSPTLEFKTDVELGRAQFESRRWNPQVMVEDIKTCQNVLQLNGVHNVPEDPTDNETSKPNEYQLDSHVQNKNTESDIENNCLQNLNLNYLDKKPTSLKMKIFKVKGNKFKVKNIEDEAKVKNIEDEATQDIVHSQTASPLCPPTIASKSSSEYKESSRFSTSSPLLQLRSCVFCSVCGLKVPRSFVEPGVMLEDTSGWQCQDCAVCILCFLRNPGEQLLVCCQCGHRYHKTCARVDQMAQQGSWVCKYCTAGYN